MPQLNPAPWLIIMLASWTILMLIFKTKTLLSTTMNDPTPPTLLTQHTAPWTWPWT